MAVAGGTAIWEWGIEMKFGEHALFRGWITEQDLSEALALQSQGAERIGMLLVRMGVLSRKRRLEILAMQTGLSYIERLGSNFQSMKTAFGERTKAYISEVGSQRVRSRRTGRGPLPIRCFRSINRLSRRKVIAIPDPCDAETIRNLKVWAPRSRIVFYDFSPQASARASTVPFEQAEGGVSSPVVDWLDEALAEGVRHGASDLHLVREAGVMNLRFRIHGRFRSGPGVPAPIQESLIPRIKVMAALDIAEERLPQDGSFERRLSGSKHDFRVSVLPGVEGEGVVIRILGGSQVTGQLASSLDEIGMPEKLLTSLRAWAQRRAGIILITGPTGSGKTTTLYALLSEFDRSELKIVTLEDPVEYTLEGAHQIQVNPEIGLTFAQGLRAILRHDPDVILVGEIRDKETAEIALRASLTGHLVLATLHTNSAVGAFTRLADMGIPVYLIADAVLGVLAQRLVGRVCRECGGADAECRSCRGSGIDGRVAIFEGGPADPLKELIRAQAPEQEMKDVLLGSGFPTLTSDGQRKVSDGLIPERELHALGLAELE